MDTVPTRTDSGQEPDEIVLVPALTVSRSVLDDIAEMTPRVAAAVKELHALGLAMGPIAVWVDSFGKGRDLDDELEDAIRTTGYYELRDLWERAETIARGTTGSRIEPGVLHWNDAYWNRIDDEVMAEDPHDAPTPIAADLLVRRQREIQHRRAQRARLDQMRSSGEYDSILTD